MEIALCYCFPDLDHKTFIPAAKRFVQSYQENPPGETPHDIWVVVNGTNKFEKWIEKLFSPLPARFLQHNNYGKDIGAFQMASFEIPCDLLVCFGSHIQFHKPAWLDYMVSAYEQYGPSLWGAWGFQFPQPHLRTTAIWLPPEIFQGYPKQVGNSDRYAFEHGIDSITLWSQKLGFEPKQLTWKGCFEMKDFQPSGREDSLFIDQHISRHAIK